jgi:hypothetical protein
VDAEATTIVSTCQDLPINVQDFWDVSHEIAVAGNVLLDGWRMGT